MGAVLLVLTTTLSGSLFAAPSNTTRFTTYSPATSATKLGATVSAPASTALLPAGTLPKLHM